MGEEQARMGVAALSLNLGMGLGGAPTDLFDQVRRSLSGDFPVARRDSQLGPVRRSQLGESSTAKKSEEWQAIGDVAPLSLNVDMGLRAAPTDAFNHAQRALDGNAPVVGSKLQAGSKFGPV